MAGQNYSRGIPMGNNQVPHFQSPPAVKAILAQMSENATASSILNLTQNTTAVEITTGGTLVAIRWIADADVSNSVAGTSVIAIAGATANYDHVVPANSRMRFVVPIEVNRPQGYGSFVGANIENGLFKWLAWKTPVAASVYSAQYGSSNSY